MVELLIVGAGIAGLTAATLLAQSGFSVTVVERETQPPAKLKASPELRVLAITPASEHILRACGAWSRMDLDRAQTWSRMQVWERSDSDGISFQTSDINQPHLGHIVEHGNLAQALYQVACEAGVTFCCPDSVTEVKLRDERVDLTLQSGEMLQSRMLIAADGAHSKIRQMMNLQWDFTAHQQQAIVAEIQMETKEEERVAWQRFTPDGPLALLPLFNGNSSLVYSTLRAEELTACSTEEFERELMEALDYRLGVMRLVGNRICVPLGRGFAPQWCSQRAALLGDAAHVVHPLAGLGQNLGLMDAAVLQEEMMAHPLTPRALRAYERRRKGPVKTVQWVLEGFRAGFSLQFPTAGLWRNTALETVGRSRKLRQFFIEQAEGCVDAPQWVRDKTQPTHRA